MLVSIKGGSNKPLPSRNVLSKQALSTEHDPVGTYMFLKPIAIRFNFYNDLLENRFDPLQVGQALVDLKWLRKWSE